MGLSIIRWHQPTLTKLITIMHQKVSIKTIAAIVIGNALEWYDFIVYSFMTVFIAGLFFPNSDPNNSLLAATATFGIGFFMRPVGGIIIGLYADKKGRKAAMTLVIGLMTAALAIIASAPTYVSIGMAAPCILLFARLLQGFSASGEFGSSTALLIELSPTHRVGLYGSWQMFGQIFAITIGGSVGMLLTHFLTTEQLTQWGWRLPFIFGLIIAPVGIYIRRHLQEDNLRSQDEPFAQLSFSEVFKHKIKHLFLSTGLAVAGTTSFYVNLIYMPTFASHYLNLSMTAAFIAITSGSLICALLIPWLGALSDIIGRKKMTIASLSLYFVTVLPCFYYFIQHPTPLMLFIYEIICCSIFSAYLAAFAATVARLFPRRIRATSLSISNNLAIMLFGGFGQFIVTWLLKVTGSLLSPAYYVSLGIGISLIAALFISTTEEYI